MKRETLKKANDLQGEINALINMRDEIRINKNANIRTDIKIRIVKYIDEEIEMVEKELEAL